MKTFRLVEAPPVVDGKLVRPAAARVLRLVPRQPVYLLCFGLCDEQRFARVFHDAWGRIPAAARRAVLAHWRGGTPYAGLPSPRIAAWPDWPGRGDSVATWAVQGHELRFWAAAVDTYRPWELALPVAYNLASVYQHASGRPPAGGDADWAEGGTLDIVHSWGFLRPPADGVDDLDPEEGLRAWQRRNPGAARCGEFLARSAWFVGDVLTSPEFARAYAARQAGAGG
jgi:hypothetical protein